MALTSPADVYVINRENVEWLIERSNIPFDYDMVVIDELSNFKSHQTKRFRSLMKVRPKVQRIVGLTGTPSSNGLMDLWTEFRLLDMGKRLGRFISHYRNLYFEPDKRNGAIVYSYKPYEWAKKEIYDRISDITISMRAEDYLTLPECMYNEVRVQLSHDERDAYNTLKANMVLKLDGKELDAQNAAALANKLCQMANGAVYAMTESIIQFTTENSMRLTI